MSESRYRVNSWLETIYGKNQSVLDEAGRCYLKQADDIGLVICVPDDTDQVHIYADLMRIPDSPSQEFLEQTLALNGMPNLTFGARVFLDRYSSQLIALYSRDINNLDLEKCINILENLPRVITSIRGELTEYMQDIGGSLIARQSQQPQLRQ
jgi:hypothetical protein